MARFLKTNKKNGKRGARLPESDDDSAIGPSPNPFTNILLATVALRGGSILVRRGLERALLGRRYSPEKAKHIVKGRTMTQSLVSGAAARVATTSVPGAILVGGGLLAKTLYDRRKGVKAVIEGEIEMQQLAETGEASTSDKPQS